MNAQSRVLPAGEIGMPTEEGGYYIAPEHVRRIGDGDAKLGRRRIRLMLIDEAEQTPHIGPVERPLCVRMGGEEDEAAVLELLEWQVRTLLPKWAKIEPDMILEQIRTGTQKRGGFVAIIDKDPEDSSSGIAAVSVLIPVQAGPTRMYVINEAYNCVHPDHRRSSHGENLLRYGCWLSDAWSRQYGYQVPFVARVSTREKVKEQMRMYRRHMTQIGALFIYPTATE